MVSRQDIWNTVVTNAISNETGHILKVEFDDVIFDEGISTISASGLAITIVENKVEIFVWFIESFLSAVNTSESLSVSSTIEHVSNDFDLSFRDILITEFGLSVSEITESNVIGKFYEVLSKHI